MIETINKALILGWKNTTMNLFIFNKQDFFTSLYKTSKKYFFQGDLAKSQEGSIK